MGYDGWLEAPAHRGEGEAQAFEQFCERVGIDYDDPEARDRFEDWCEAGAEAAAERRAEARADWLEDRANDRDEW